MEHSWLIGRLGRGDDLLIHTSKLGCPPIRRKICGDGLASDSKAMEDYIWSRDYVDALLDFGHVGFNAQQTNRRNGSIEAPGFIPLQAVLTTSLGPFI